MENQLLPVQKVLSLEILRNFEVTLYYCDIFFDMRTRVSNPKVSQKGSPWSLETTQGIALSSLLYRKRVRREHSERAPSSFGFAI